MNKSKNAKLIRVAIEQIVLKFALASLSFAGAWSIYYFTGYDMNLEKQLLLWRFVFLPLGIALGALTWAWSYAVLRVARNRLKQDKRPLNSHHKLIKQIKARPCLFPFICLPAFAEELFFRGFMQGTLIEYMNLRKIEQPALIGIVLPALVFAMMHRDKSGKRWTAPHLVNTFARIGGSSCWGMAAYLTGSLWPAILAHGTQNLIVAYRGNKLIRQRRPRQANEQ